MAALQDCVSLLKAWPELAQTMGMTSSNCCSIGGLSCNGQARVTTLALNGYSFSTADLGNKAGIGGLAVNPGNPIPTALFDLTAMQTMWMTGAGLTGEIPTGFGRMQSLYELHLESNELVGGFPSDWSQLLNLRYFHADGNKLSILPGPDNLGAPGMLLKTFLLQNNQFTGHLSSWVGTNLQGTW
ncbi:hypothetical protein BC830DRAFT_1143623 [Chytriomyces sp. MP71]|nr:hypothetical protein BC830DRAFT_1143623 [Chytriomyces sp. MP71]